ncbi:MAG: hypothetical protein WBV23_07780 [Desulfobaccales bacterium]
MPNADDILWLKKQFHRQIKAAVKDTPFSLDMLTAIACQESGEIWPILRKKPLSLGQLLELCVGDTIDTSGGRQAFPKTKSDLLAKPKGEQMFAIARQALVDMAHYIKGYQAAAANPEKFCHGFGIFQYDLQFFLEDPDYFLQKRYADFDASLGKCIGELHNAMKRIHWDNKTTLTDYEMACVAIAYNTGGFKPGRGLQQGYRPPGGKYYGEEIFALLRLSKTVALPGAGPAALSAPQPGNAAVPPPTPVEATGPFYEVDVRQAPLRLRREPQIDANDPNANVMALLPDGQPVRAVKNREVNGFLEVETSLWGAHHRGFASARYLKPAPGGAKVPIVTPAPAPPSRGIVAVYMPSQPGVVTRRTDPPDAHSLNEPNQPGRRGATPDDLRAELAAIIDWLAVDDATHRRYQPGKNTYCNIYAHDYCYLAGAYLPRVWWTPGAIEKLAQGKDVQPFLENTIDEQRANDLFRWLRDFGPRFGWQGTGTVSKLQLEVNQGAIGLIVARRKEDGRPGHIVAVVPETDNHRARRDAAGEVIAPLQSQAGSTNFRYGTRLNWWRDDRFADSAFWLHS